MSENPVLPVDQNFWGNVDEAADAADTPLPRYQYGQLTIGPGQYTHWVNKQPIDVTAEEFSKLPAKERALKILFSINVQEMNPELDWSYERMLRPGESDWHKILKPSIVALMGKDSMSKGNYSKTLQELSGKYVEAMDVTQTKNPEYNTIQLVRIFDSKEACFAAYKERFGDSVSASSALPSRLSTPEGWETGAWLTVVVDVEAALTAGQTVKQIADEYDVPVANIAEIKAQMSG